MKRHTAEKEARRLNREDPNRGRVRWVAAADDDGSWSVRKIARVTLDGPRPTAPVGKAADPTEAAEPAGPTAAAEPAGPNTAPAATAPAPRRRAARRPRRPRGPDHPAPPRRAALAAFLRRPGVRIPALAVALAGAAWALWELRLLFRPLYMTLLVRHPALVSIPLLAGGAALLVHVLARVARPGGARRLWQQARRGSSTPLWRLGPVVSFLVVAGLGLLLAGAMTSVWTGAAIYDHTDYGALALGELRGGEVRIKPYQVAKRQTENGLNSPTERPTNLHIAKVDGRLAWTSVRDPDGIFRILTKPTAGVMSVDASSTGPGVRQSGPRHDGDFRYGPGMRISESVRWQVYKKRCFSCDVAEMTALPTAEGPMVIAPYVRYEGGWFVRRPVWGGVYVVHPDGRIEDLSPREAAARPALRESGRIYPEKLARRTADAYKYKRGIWNRLFVHTAQLEVADTETNRQPFLQDFDQMGPQWVTTLKPRGGTFTTAAVMTTDAVTGESRVWLAARGQALIGNQRAVDIVRGETFPGVVFAAPDATGVNGRFLVVEPRQIFPRGRLQFLLSVIPDSANRVTLSVVVDAASQRVVAQFPATTEGDGDLIAYLRDARLPGGSPAGGNGNEQATGDEAGEPPAQGEAGEADSPDRGRARPPAGPAATLRRLLRENRLRQREAIDVLEAQERDLRRLLREIERRE